MNELGAMNNADLLKHAEKENIETGLFQSQTVVADFSLPYLCCGVGPVHLHEAAPRPPVPVSMTAELEGRCFSNEQIEDGIPVNFTVSEAGGEITFRVNDLLVGAAYNNVPFTGEELMTDLTTSMFESGKLDVRVNYNLNNRFAEDVVTIYHKPDLAVERFTFLETIFRDERNWVCFALKLKTDALPADQLAYLGDQQVRFDPESGKLIVPLDLLLENQSGRIEVGGNDCLNSSILDYCEALARGMTLKGGCDLAGPCKIECKEEFFRSEESVMEQKIPFDKLTGGVIELCPSVPGGHFRVLSATTADEDDRFNRDGLVLEKYAATEGEPVVRYYLVLDFLRFEKLAALDEIKLDCFREDGLFPFQQEQALSKTHLINVRLQYGFAGCDKTFQEITIEVVKELREDDDGGGSNDPGNTPSIPSALNATLNVRRAERQAKLTAMGEEEDLTADPAFRRAFSYLIVAGDGANPKTGLDASLKNLKKLVDDEPDHAAFARKAGEIIATSFLDKLALQKKAVKLTTAENKLIEQLKKGLVAIDVSLNTTFKSWGVSDLYDGPDKARLTAIGRKLRE